MSSYLLRITPENNFDVHVLRTFTRELNAWIVPLQTSAPHASETINQVIYALNLTFRDVELSYLVWRTDRIQGILRSGFQYARGRIQAAIWRRERGRPATTFTTIYPSFQFAGHQNPSPDRQTRPAAQDGSYYQANAYGAAVPGASTWGAPQQPNQQYIQNNNFPRRNEQPAALPQAGAVAGYAPGFAPEGSGRGVIDYPPPPYPPANWKPPDPVPGSPPVPPVAQAGVDVAIRYLEAVQKAVGVCIDLDAM